MKLRGRRRLTLMEMSQKRLQLTPEYHKELYSALSSSFMRNSVECL
jgi:hypothetical protein